METMQDRSDLLENARITLKKEFVCLDGIIDRLIDSIKLWFINPDLLERAPIICLWGPTGTGKSSIIKRLMNLLQMNDKFVHFSMNSIEEQLSGQNNSFQKTLFAKTDTTASKNVVFLDEFQWFQTKSKDGEGKKATDFNDLWDFLSEREIRKETLHRTISDITKALYYFAEGGQRYGFIDPSDAEEQGETLSTADFGKRPLCRLLENYELEFLQKALYSHISLKELAFMSIDQFMEMYKKTIEDKSIWKDIDCRKHLIIISGNLDSAYSFCDNINYDMDADFYHSLSKRLNIGDIKDCLQEIFKDEHISRMGNMHLIFPTINKKGYEEIIKNNVELHIKRFREKQDIDIIFTQSVYDMLYNNSVYPTQGTRPVFSTINDFFNSVVGQFVLHSVMQNKKEIKVSYNYKKSAAIASFDDEKQVVPYIGDIDKVKNEENKKLNQKMMSAGHEAGHCIVYSLLNGFVPNKVVVSTSTHYGGFVMTDKAKFSLTQFENDAKVCYAGIEAEKVLFGDQNVTSGAGSDIEVATADIAFILRKSGIVYDTNIVSEGTPEGEYADTDIGRTNETLQGLAMEYRRVVNKMLKKNKKILVRLTDYLYSHNVVDGEMLIEFFKAQGLNFSVKPYNPTEDVFTDNLIINKFDVLRKKYC